MATDSSEDQPGGEGALSQGIALRNTTCVYTDIHSPMNKRGIAKIISVVYGASVHKSTAAVMTWRADSGGVVLNKDVLSRLSEIHESVMVTLVHGPDRGRAHSSNVAPAVRKRVERDGVNRGKCKMATGRSEDQPGGEGALSQGITPRNTTCFDTDIYSPMN